jgi:hypothetical protein
MASDILLRCVVYGLRSSLSQEVRYIGQTKLPLRKRLMNHISSAKRGGRTYRDNWIRSVLSSGGSIEITTLVEHAEWSTTEVELIAKYRSEGARLVNTTSGGDGVRDLPVEIRRRISEKMKGRKLSVEHRRLMSVRRKGVPLPAKHRQNMVAAIRRAHAERGEEIGRKISLANKGHLVSQLTRDKIAATKVGKPRDSATREKVALAMKVRFSDPNQREQVSRVTKEAMRRPEVKQRLLASMAERWSDPAQRTAQAERLRKLYASPEARAAQAEKRAKLTNDQVIEARQLRKDGASLKSLCERFGIAMGPMSMLCNGKTFKHLPL